MPKENDSAIVSISITTGVCRRRGGTGDRASAWGDAGESGATAGRGGSQPTNAGTMAALVGGRVHADRVLAIGNGAFGCPSGEDHVAAIVAGVFSKGDRTRENHRSTALHPASDERFSHSRNVRFAVLPQKTPGDLAERP